MAISIVRIVLAVCIVQLTFATTQQDFVGTWKLTDSENFDAYLEKLGVNWFTRKAAVVIKPDMVISIDGDKWKIEQKSTFRNIAWEFELDKEFDTTAADGREVKSTFTFVDGKLIHVEKAKTAGEVNSKVVRSIENGKIVANCDAEGVTARRVYERATE